MMGWDCVGHGFAVYGRRGLDRNGIMICFACSVRFRGLEVVSCAILQRDAVDPTTSDRSSWYVVLPL